MIYEDLRLVAIGGGTPGEIPEQFLERALNLSGATKPNMLIAPTARPNQHELELSLFKMAGFANEIGIELVPLHTKHGVLPSREELVEKTQAADVVYVSGGNTLRMMELWRANGYDDILRHEATRGLVLSGISAGAIAPFREGHSDSMSFEVPEGEPWDYVAVEGLNLLPATITPHYDSHPEGMEPRAESFMRMAHERFAAGAFDVGLGINNYAALELAEGRASVITTQETAGVSRLLPVAGIITVEFLPSGSVLPVADLLAATQ